jgi:hypothetical protein
MWHHMYVAPYVCGTICMWHHMYVAPYVCGTPAEGGGGLLQGREIRLHGLDRPNQPAEACMHIGQCLIRCGSRSWLKCAKLCRFLLRRCKRARWGERDA